MNTIVAALAVAASPMLFEAQVPTYGCSSGAEVSKLQSVRADETAFQQRLTEQVTHGQCVTIPLGSVVEGSPAETGPATLLIEVKRDPPGYIVPSADFKPASAPPR